MMASMTPSSPTLSIDTVLEPKEQKPDEDAAVLEKGNIPLRNNWRMWYFENLKDKEWEECLRLVGPFHTPRGFWTIFNHVTSPSGIRTGGSYYVFKDGVKPMWEDEANRNGGRWRIVLNKDQPQNLDYLWFELMFCLLCDAFDDDGVDVCGFGMDIRGQEDRLSVWTSDFKNEVRIMNIGKIIKRWLRLEDGLLWYHSHQATAPAGSGIEPLFTL